MNWLRTAIACLVAPLVVPVTGLTFQLTRSPDRSATAILDQVWTYLLSSGLVAYATALAVAMPVYLGLRACNVVAFWPAPVIGYALGTVTMFLVPLSPLSVRGVVGGLVGALLWLIDRPDRQSRNLRNDRIGRERLLRIHQKLWPEAKDPQRTVVAFIVAPLFVPLLFWLQAFAHTLISGDNTGASLVPLVVLAAAIVTYAGAIAFGLPGYLLLRARGATALGIALAFGFVAGAIVSAVFVQLLWGDRLAVGNLIWSGLNLGGPAGALVGAIFWLIDRPDRQVLPRDWTTRLRTEHREPVVGRRENTRGLLGGTNCSADSVGWVFCAHGGHVAAVIVYRIMPHLPFLGILRGALVGGGFMGATVGAIFWLIDRPDRRSRAADKSDQRTG